MSPEPPGTECRRKRGLRWGLKEPQTWGLGFPLGRRSLLLLAPPALVLGIPSTLLPPGPWKVNILRGIRRRRKPSGQCWPLHPCVGWKEITMSFLGSTAMQNGPFPRSAPPRTAKHSKAGCPFPRPGPSFPPRPAPPSAPPLLSALLSGAGDRPLNPIRKVTLPLLAWVPEPGVRQLTAAGLPQGDSPMTPYPYL